MSSEFSSVFFLSSAFDWFLRKILRCVFAKLAGFQISSFVAASLGQDLRLNASACEFICFGLCSFSREVMCNWGISACLLIESQHCFEVCFCHLISFLLVSWFIGESPES